MRPDRVGTSSQLAVWDTGHSATMSTTMEIQNGITSPNAQSGRFALKNSPLRHVEDGVDHEQRYDRALRIRPSTSTQAPPNSRS